MRQLITYTSKICVEIRTMWTMLDISSGVFSYARLISILSLKAILAAGQKLRSNIVRHCPRTVS